MNSYFITATGTDIGKTLVTTALASQLARKGNDVCALKPVISGYQSGDMASDSALILQSLGVELTEEAVASISPWRFAAALAPTLAAHQEGVALSLAEIVDFCRAKANECAGVTLVEGAGGVMSPLAEGATNLDLMKALGWPVILVAGSYLGGISHLLTALAAMKMHGVRVQAVIISESEGSGVTLEDTVIMAREHVDNEIRIVPLSYIPEMLCKWKHVADISGVCHE